MQPDAAPDEISMLWEVDPTHPPSADTSPSPVCGLIRCGTCIIPSSLVSLTWMLTLRFSMLPNGALRGFTSTSIFLVSLDIRLKKLVDERECLLEQVNHFITLWVPWAAPEPENLPILNFLLYRENPNALCLKAITKPTCVLTSSIIVSHVRFREGVPKTRGHGTECGSLYAICRLKPVFT